MAAPRAMYVQIQDDMIVESLSGGAIKTYVLTPKQYWGLPMASLSFLAGMSITQLSANAGITVKYQWSLDGVNWNTGVGTVIAEKVVLGDTTATNQVTATLSVWEYVRYGS